MKILLVSNTCSPKKYKKIFSERKEKMIDPSQKFFHLLVQGMSSYANITCMSAIPVSAGTHRRWRWGLEKEIVSSSLCYEYIGFINGKILRHICLFVNSFFMTLRWLIKNKTNKEKIIICDPLLLACASSAKLAGKLCNTKCICILTDIPELVTEIGHRKSSRIRSTLQSFYDKLSQKNSEHYDGYVVLTQQMNSRVNKKNKPNIIIEGSVDNAMILQKNSLEVKHTPRVIMYAGGVHEKFGVTKLINLFTQLDIVDIELRIYGSGQAVEYVKKIAKKDSRIKYMGIVTTDQVVQEEVCATLLINPRPSDEEFTKYSFPSKTLEYMASGTPLLTTRLAGIPAEYDDYLYYFDSESEARMLEKVFEIISKNEVELLNKGLSAKAFVLKKKSNITQGKKIVDFSKELIGKTYTGAVSEGYYE